MDTFLVTRPPCIQCSMVKIEASVIVSECTECYCIQGLVTYYILCAYFWILFRGCFNTQNTTLLLLHISNYRSWKVTSFLL